MSLNVNTRFSGGNAADIEMRTGGECPEVRFASDPRGGAASLWFRFRIEETAPDPARQSKVRLTWTQVESAVDTADPALVRPVVQSGGHGWTRLKHGEKTVTPDGRLELSWLIPHPAPATDVALCFPYADAELRWLLQRYTEYWHATPIGLSQGGLRIVRLSNVPGHAGNTQPGLYLVARQHAEETAGSWVLDGVLQHLAQLRKAGYVFWAVPFVNPDGIEEGRNGWGATPDGNAWGTPPRRHETRVIQDDVRRWKARCRPLLALEFAAAPAASPDAVYVEAGPDAAAPAAAEEVKWANVLRTELQAEFADPEFKRSAAPAAAGFAEYARAELGIPALRLRIPGTQARDTLLTQKLYREIGRRLAAGVLRRHG